MNKSLTAIIFSLLLTGMLFNVAKIQLTNASETIYIRADGSIDPPTAPISTSDKVTYTFTGNIYDSIAVEKNNIVVDGSNYTVQGTGADYSRGIDLTGRSNVTIKNMNIMAFDRGFYLDYSSNDSISGNNVTNNSYGIQLDYSSNDSISGNNIRAHNEYGVWLYSSSNDSISGNSITANNDDGIALVNASNNSIVGNNISNNDFGILLSSSSNNNVSRNNVTANNHYGIRLDSSSSNAIYHNNFVNNQQVDSYASTNVWDDGYPSGGNYWGDYRGVDSYGGPYQNETGGDGIGDTAYVINTDNQDNYPIINPWFLPTGMNLTITTNGGGTTYPEPGTYVSLSGTVVSVSALPDTGYYLDRWELDYLCIGISNPINVTMDKNHTLNAGFEPLNIGHDVAVKWIASSKTIVGQGYFSKTSVDVVNAGSFAETINITLYANITSVVSQNVTVEGGMPATISFTWNSSGFPKGNYALGAYAWPVSGEDDMADNNLTGGWIIVAMIGDVTGPGGYPDGKIDARDVAGICSRYGAKPPDPGHDVNWDITGPTQGLADGKIDARDVSLVSSRFGQKDP